MPSLFHCPKHQVDEDTGPSSFAGEDLRRKPSLPVYSMESSPRKRCPGVAYDLVGRGNRCLSRMLVRLACWREMEADHSCLIGS